MLCRFGYMSGCMNRLRKSFVLNAIVNPGSSDGTTKTVQVYSSWHEPDEAIVECFRDMLTPFIIL